MPVSGVVPDVRSRIHMQRDAPFFQVFGFSKKGGGGFRSAPFRRCHTRVVRSTYVSSGSARPRVRPARIWIHFRPAAAETLA